MGTYSFFFLKNEIITLQLFHIDADIEHRRCVVGLKCSWNMGGRSGSHQLHGSFATSKQFNF